MAEEPTSPTRRRWSIAPYFIVDVAATANYYRDALGFKYERLWGDPPRFCMVYRSGIIIMLSQLDGSGLMRPNSQDDPELSAWDAYVWVDDADALLAEFRSRGVTMRATSATSRTEIATSTSRTATVTGCASGTTSSKAGPGAACRRGMSLTAAETERNKRGAEVGRRARKGGRNQFVNSAGPGTYRVKDEKEE